MTSIKPLLYKHKKLKDGSHPIVIQFIKGRKRKLFSLGQSAKEDEWIEDKGLPNMNHPYQLKLTHFIRSKVDEAKDITLDFESGNKPYTLEDIIIKIKGKTSSEYLFVYFDRIIEQLRGQDKKGNEMIYQSTKKSLQSFHAEDILMTKIDNRFLNAYENYLSRKGLKRNSIFVYMKTLRALLNKAITEGVLNDENDPFKKYTVRSETTAKVAISKDDINRIRDLELGAESALDMARDIFMFSFYNRGMSFVDLAFLKHSDLIDGRMVYKRRKTGQKFSVKITEQSQAIIDKYSDPNREYIFPLITRPENKYLDYKNAARLMNKKLKKIAASAGIEAELTTYTSRHSWATIAKWSGIPTAVISEGLGHATEETTQIYLDSFKYKALDDANELITQ